MAISRVKTWISGEVLTASDLNGEFDNFINNALAFLSPLTGTLNANSNQITNLKLEQRTSDGTAAESIVWYRTDRDQIEVHDGSNARQVPSLTAVAGDVIYASAANQWARLAKGTALQVLRMNSGATAPEWGAPTAGVLEVQVFS